jgi:hypothetical protein
MERIIGKKGGERNTGRIWCENNSRNVSFEVFIVGVPLTLKYA